MITDTLISLVAMNIILIPASYKAWNISEATPLLPAIPAPTIEILLTSGSMDRLAYSTSFCSRMMASARSP